MYRAVIDGDLVALQALCSRGSTSTTQYVRYNGDWRVVSPPLDYAVLLNRVDIVRYLLSTAEHAHFSYRALLWCEHADIHEALRQYINNHGLKVNTHSSTIATHIKKLETFRND